MRRRHRQRALSGAVGARLRDQRERRRLSQAVVAAAAGITQSSISNYESGRRDIPLVTLLRALEYLECPPAEFFSGLDGFIVPTPQQRRILRDTLGLATGEPE